MRRRARQAPLSATDQPAIYVSTSGMLDGRKVPRGKVGVHLKDEAPVAGASGTKLGIEGRQLHGKKDAVIVFPSWWLRKGARTTSPPSVS